MKQEDWRALAQKLQAKLDALNPICERCGLRAHRYGVPPDRDNHAPTAVACANQIIGLLEDLYGNLPSRLSTAITKLAFEIQREKP